MPIRFSCEHCGQRLRIASRKAGEEVRCPKCDESIPVPAENAVQRPPTPPDAPDSESESVSEAESPPDKSPLSEFMVYDDDVEWVYESDDPDENEAAGRLDLDKVAVPRVVLYMQGILLAVVALIAFTIGVLVGGGDRSHADRQTTVPSVLEGRVEYVTNGDRPRADKGSVVLVLPAEHQPGRNERASIEGLRPQDPLPNETNAGLRAIRAMGGSYTRTDDQGAFRLRVAQSAKYFVLFVSANAYRESDEDLNKTDLAQIGRYVLPATDLLGDHAYNWVSVTINRDRTIDHQF